MPGTKSFLAKPEEVAPRWFLIDATDRPLGRLASDIAMMLMGKNRPSYTPHVLTGDCVVVVNAEKVGLTGQKWNKKSYNWFTGYTGKREETAQERRARRPDLLVTLAVRRMLPKNKLARYMLDRLKVYTGSEHPHQAQKPEPRVAGNRKHVKSKKK